MTATEAFNKATEDGTIGERQKEVLNFIELWERDNAQGFSRGDVGRFFNDARCSHQRRLRDLEVIGLIQQTGTKLDETTGHTVKCYRSTGGKPLVKPRLAPSLRKQMDAIAHPIMKLLSRGARGQIRMLDDKERAAWNAAADALLAAGYGWEEPC